MPGFNSVSPLRIDREVRQDCQIFRLDGIFDIFSVPTFWGVLHPLLEESSQSLILDLSAVDLIDSSALDALVALGRQIRKSGGTLQIVGVNRYQRLMAICNHVCD